MSASISVRNLTLEVPDKKRSKKLLSKVSFEVEEGKFIAVIGASGCGKSTLIKCLAGLLKPTEGNIYFAGREVLDLNDQLPLAVGYLPQFGGFHELMSVSENLEVAGSLRLPRSVTPERRAAWTEHIVEFARIGQLLPQPYKTLSGGQMRRMALAEALIGDPAFLLLDELTSGLDAFSDQEMMAWLRNLTHTMGKTVVLVTHTTTHLDYCDAILFLHQGRLIHYGDLASLLEVHEVNSIEELFGIYQTQEIDYSGLDAAEEVNLPLPEPAAIRSQAPPTGWGQFLTLLGRQGQLFWRDRGQIWLQVALILTFPALVAVFAMHGLPQVRNQTLQLQTNILATLQDQLLFMKESFKASSLISGLAMFQVVLLTLIGANNGAREIAKERAILAKELRTGLSPTAYLITKFLQVAGLCLVQAFWMALFVKTVCGFPGSLLAQVAILFMTTLAMSTTCLAISAASPSPERASLLAIYLVGFQLPLSGAALALPEWLSSISQPLIAAYWGWSGYLQTFHDTRYFDIVMQATKTSISAYGMSMVVLAIHVVITFMAAVWLVGRIRTRGGE